MTHSIFLPIALWIWAVSAVGSVVFMIWLWIAETSSWKGRAAILAFLVTASGLLFCSLELLGHPLLALWSWRVLSAAVMIASLLFWAAIFVQAQPPAQYNPFTRFSLRGELADIPDRFLMTGAVLFAMAVFACSVLAGTPQAIAASPAAPVSATVAHDVADTVARLDFWHAATLGVLGCGTLLFGLLFLSALQQQGPLWFESHSGGLGGSVGGWRMSASVGYLAAAILFAALFGALMIHDENQGRASGTPANPVPSASANAQNASSVSTTKTEPEQKGQSPAPAPSSPATRQQ